MDQKTQSNLTALTNPQNSNSLTPSFQQSTVIQSEQFFAIDTSYEDLQHQIQQLRQQHQNQLLHTLTVVDKQGFNVRVQGQVITVVSEKEKKREKGVVAQLLAQNKQLKIELELANNKLMIMQNELSYKRSNNKPEDQDSADQLKILAFELQSKNIEIQQLNNTISMKDQQLSQLKIQLEHFQTAIEKINSSKLSKSIKEIPVYIQKDLVVEVPVPIYINQKEQKINARLMPLLGSSQEQNSIAANDINDSMEIQEKQDQKEGNQLDLNNKLGSMCRSIVGSNVGSNFSQQIRSNPKIEESNQNTRNPRIKQIIEVPVYIVKQIQKIVEKPIIQEVIKYVEVDRGSRELKSFNNEEENPISCITPRKESHSEQHQQAHLQLLLQSHQKATPPESNIEDQADYPESDSINQKQPYLKIQEQPQLKQQSKQSSLKPQKPSQISNHKYKQQILLEIPVEIQKQILVPIQVPVEIFVEIEKLREVPIIQQKIVIKQIQVEKPIYINKTIEIITTQIATVQIPYQIFVDREIQKIVERLLPVQVPVQIMIPEKLQNNIAIKGLEHHEENVIEAVKEELQTKIERSQQKQEKEHNPIQLKDNESPDKIQEKILIQQYQQHSNESQQKVQQAILPLSDVEEKYIEPLIIEVPTQIYVEKIVTQEPIVTEVIRQIQIIKEVPVEKQVVIEKEKVIQIVKEIPIEIPIEVEKIIKVQVPVQTIKVEEREVEKIVQVIKYIQVQTLMPIEIPVEIIVEKEVMTIVQIPQPQVMEIQKVDSNIQLATEHEPTFIEVPIQIHIPSERSEPLIIQKIVQKVDSNIQLATENEPIFIEVPIQIHIPSERSEPQIVQKIVQVERTIEVQKPIYVEKIIQKFIQVQKPVQKIVEVEKIVYVDRMPQIIEVPVEKQIQYVEKVVEVIKQVPVEKMAQIIEIPVDRIVEVERIIEVQIPVQIIKQVIVDREIIVEKIIHVEVPVQILVERTQIIERQVPVQIEKPVEVIRQIFIQIPHEIYIQVEKSVVIIQQVPIEITKQIIVELERQVIKEIIVQKPIQVKIEVIRQIIKQVIVEKLVEVEKQIIRQIEVERIVEVQKQVIKQVEVQKIVEVEKEVIKEVIVERPTQIEREILIEVPVQVVKEIIKEVTVEKLVEVEKEVIKEIQIEKIVVVEKQVLKEIIVERPVQVIIEIEREVIKEVIVEKPIYIEKQVLKQIFIEVPIEIIREVQKQVIRQIIVEKPIQIIKEIEKEVIKQIVVENIVQIIKQVEKEIVIEMPVQIIKEVIVEKEVFIEIYAQRQGSPQTPPAQVELLELKPNSHQSNQGVLLSDSSDEGREQQENFPIPSNQNFQIAEGGWKQQKEILIQRYSDHERKLHEQLEFLRDELTRVSKKIQFLEDQNIKLEEELQRNLEESQELKKKSKNNRVLEMQIQQLKQNVEKQSKNREREQKLESLKIKELNQTISSLKTQLKQEKTSHQAIQQKLHTLERSKDHEMAQIYKQLDLKNQQLEDLALNQQQLVEHNNYLKQQHQKISTQRNNLEQQCNQLKNILDQRQQDDFVSKDQIEYRINQEVSKTEKIYQRQIEDLIHKNYGTINSKNQEISELSNIIKELENQIGKANDYIQKIPEDQIPKNYNSRTSVKSHDTKLQEQNQKLSMAVEILQNELQQYKQKSQSSQIRGEPKRSDIAIRPANSALTVHGASTVHQKQVPRTQKSRIKIEEIGKSYDFEQEEDMYQRMNKLVNDYARELQKKDKQLEKMKELLCMYEAVIEDLQREKSNPYHNRNYQGTSQGFYRPATSQNKLNLDTNVYVSNLLRKIALLEEQVKFEKSQKLKSTIRARQLERAFEEINVRQASQSIQDDSQLIEKLVYQLQHEKDNCEQFRLENQALSDDLYRLKNQLQMLKNNSYIPKSEQHSMLEDLDEQFEKEFYGDKQETIIRHYKTYKIKYIKVLELTQLIKKQVTGLQLRASKNCLDIIDNIKRYIKIIENNQKNSTNNTRNKEPIISRQMQKKQKQEQDLLRDIKKIDASLSYEEDRVNIQKRESKNIRYSDFTFDNLILKNPPRQVKYLVSFKLIQFGLQLLQQRQIDNLWPEKIFVMHFSPNNTDSLRLTLAKKQKSKEKVRLYQAPEVLVGQPQSAKSYSWTIGIIIDKLFHGRLFYQKFGDILDHKDNYEFEDIQYKDIGEIVEQMVTKNREHRLALETAYEEVSALLK